MAMAAIRSQYGYREAGQIRRKAYLHGSLLLDRDLPYESRNAARHGYLVNQNGYIFRNMTRDTFGTGIFFLPAPRPPFCVICFRIAEYTYRRRWLRDIALKR